MTIYSPSNKSRAAYWVIGLAGVTAIAATLIFARDYKTQAELERVSLQGTVVEENNSGTYYTFSMRTDYGTKAIVVYKKKDGPEISSIDTLIQPGTKVTVDGIIKRNISDRLEFWVTTDDVKPE